ncbi:MAG: TOTE conflict system archaeo-eukaryotic primase domain-containing protein [Candidatus Limnocylindrales bacterium]
MSEPGAADVIATYVAAFAPRLDVYNRWAGDHYVTVREPLTVEVVRRALDRRAPVGAYFPGADGLTQVGALDFDTNDGWARALDAGRWLVGAGVPCAVERSRAGRAHLWLAAEVAVPAVTMHRALRVAVAGVGLDRIDRVELRPATERAPRPGNLGHALRLPTMPHPLTGERHPLVNPVTGAPLGSTLTATLAGLRRAAPWTLDSLAARFAPLPVESAAVRPRATPVRDSPIQRFNRAVGVCTVLAREWGVERAAPGRTVRCPGHDDRSPSLSISADDTRVWCHSPGCALAADGHGVDAYDVWRLGRR